MSNVTSLPRRSWKHSSKRRAYDQLMHLYMHHHPNEADGPIEPHKIAEWAIATRSWRKPTLSPEDVLRSALARYLKSEHIVDPQGRRVRKYVGVYTEIDTPDGVVWRSRSYPIFLAPPEHMQLSLQLRRRAVFHDVRQMALDLESYNENNIHGAMVPGLDYNLNLDLAESRQPTSYPSAPPDEADGDDDEEI